MAKGFVLTSTLAIQAPNMRNVVRNINNQLKGVNANVNVNLPKGTAGQLQTVSQNLQNVSNNAKAAGRSAQRMGSSFRGALSYLMKYDLARSIINAFVNTIRDGVTSAIAFEREMVKVSQVTGKTMNSLKGLEREITSLSTSLGVSSSSLVKTSRVLAQTGMTARDVRISLDALAKTTLAATFDDITSTTETAIAAMRQFNIEASNLERELGRINALAANFAVEAGDIGVAIRRAGGAFKAAGGQLMELEAMFTAVRSTTRETAETIATGFRTIFTRIQRPKTIQFLRQVGVELQDLAGNFVGPYEAVRRLNIALKDLDPRDVRYSQIVEQLGGFRQVSKVIPLIQQFGVAQKALNVAQSGGTSLARDAAKAQQSVAVQVVKVKEEFQALFRTFMGSSGMQAMVKMALELAKALATVAETLGPMIPMLTALAAAKGVAFLAGGMGRGKNQGGRINKFARGGLVPGRGNRDTVPAMLTPGEFVIRKSSVQAIGADNLHGWNRYSNGTPRGGAKRKKSTAKPKKSFVGQHDLRTMTAGAIANVTASKQQGHVDKLINNTKSKTWKNLQTQDKFTGTVKVFSIPHNKKQDPTGQTFEAEVAKAFGGSYERIGGNSPVDARYNRLPVEVKDVKRKTSDRQLLSKLFRARSGQSPKFGIGGAFSQLTEEVDKKGGASVDLGNMYYVVNSDKLAPKKQETKTRDTGLRKNSTRMLSRVRFGRKNAGGGLPRSSDTVPALLTPGEFVINRKSAQRIGYGNLDRANRFGQRPKGFAKGGAVGGVRVQKFNDGGKASIGDRAIGIMFGLEMILPMLAANFKEVDGEVNMMKEGMNAFTQTLMMATAGQMLFGEKLTEYAGKVGISGGQIAGIVAIAGTFYTYHKMMENAAKKMQEFAMKDIEAGAFKSQTETTRARKQFAEGAAQEAESGSKAIGSGIGAVALGGLGSLLGPFGTAAGAALGGYLGGLAGGALSDAEGKAAEALIKFDSKVRTLRLGEALGNVEKQLKLFTEGKVSGRAIAASVSDGINQLDRAFAEITTVEGLQAFDGMVQKSIPGFADFINRMAANVDSFAELEQIVGTDTLNAFSQLSGVSLERMRKEIEDGVEVRKRSNAAQKAQIQSIRQLNKVLYGARDAVSAFAAIEHKLTAFDNALSNAEQSINNTFGQAALGKIAPNFNDISNILDFSAFNQHVDSISSTLGSTGAALGNDLKQFAALNSLLPNILTEAAGEIGIGGARASEIIEAKLMAADPGGIIGAEFRKMIVRRVQAAAEMGEGGEGKFAGRIREDIQGVVRDLTKGMSETQQAFQRAAEFIDKANARLAKAYDLRTKLELKIVQQQQNILQLQYENAERIRKLRKQPANEQAAGQSFATQQNFLLAGTAVAGFGTNIGVVSTEFIRLKEKIRKSNAELESFGLDPAATTGQLTESQKKLLDENARLKEQFAKTKMVLENYSNVQQRIAIIQERLAEEELKRSQIVSAGEKFAFATNESRADIMKAMRATAIAIQGGLGRIPDQMRPQVLGILDQFSEIAMFNGMTGKQAKAELTIAELERVFGPLPNEMKKAIRGATSEQERLIQQQIKMQKEAEQAQMALLAGMKKDRQDLAKTIAGLHKQLTTELKNIFLRQEQRTLERELSEAKGQRAASENSLKELQRIRAMGIPVQDPRVLSAIRANIESVRSLKEARATRSKLQAAQGFNVGGGFETRKRGEGMGAQNLRALGQIGEQLRGRFGLDLGNQISAALQSALAARMAGLEEGESLSAGEIQKFLQSTLSDFVGQQIIQQDSIISQGVQTLNAAGIGPYTDKLINNLDQVTESLAKVPKDETWQSLTRGLQNLTATINTATNDIAANRVKLNIAAGGGVVAPGAGGGGGAGGNVPVFATGGSVFAPKGTDTVPAMLTPGEFVVNRKAAQKNMGALKSLNSGKTQYLADGGPVKFFDGSYEGGVPADPASIGVARKAAELQVKKDLFKMAVLMTRGGKDEAAGTEYAGIEGIKTYNGAHLKGDVDWNSFGMGFSTVWAGAAGTQYPLPGPAFQQRGVGSMKRWKPTTESIGRWPALAQSLSGTMPHGYGPEYFGPLFDYGKQYHRLIHADGRDVAAGDGTSNSPFTGTAYQVFPDLYQDFLETITGANWNNSADFNKDGTDQTRTDRANAISAELEAFLNKPSTQFNKPFKTTLESAEAGTKTYSGHLIQRSSILDFWNSQQGKIIKDAYPYGEWVDVRNWDRPSEFQLAGNVPENPPSSLAKFHNAYKNDIWGVSEAYGTGVRKYLNSNKGIIQAAFQRGDDNSLKAVKEIIDGLDPRGGGGFKVDWRQWRWFGDGTFDGTEYTRSLWSIKDGVRDMLANEGITRDFFNYKLNPIDPSTWGQYGRQANDTMVDIYGRRLADYQRLGQILDNAKNYMSNNKTSAGYGSTLDGIQTALFGGIAINGIGLDAVKDFDENAKVEQEKLASQKNTLKEEVNENFKFMRSPILTGGRLASHMNKVTDFMLQNRIKYPMPRHSGINRRWLQGYEFDEDTAYQMLPFLKGLGHDLGVLVRGGLVTGMDSSGLKLNQGRISAQLSNAWDWVHQTKGKVKDVTVMGVTGGIGPGMEGGEQGVVGPQGMYANREGGLNVPIGNAMTFGDGPFDQKGIIGRLKSWSGHWAGWGYGDIGSGQAKAMDVFFGNGTVSKHLGLMQDQVSKSFDMAWEAWSKEFKNNARPFQVKPVNKADGGTIFAPKGTDTVPAMLTPGEFVVNRKAAQKNMGALKALNSGKTQYLAGGGPVSEAGIKKEIDERVRASHEQERVQSHWGHESVNWPPRKIFEGGQVIKNKKTNRFQITGLDTPVNTDVFDIIEANNSHTRWYKSKGVDSADPLFTIDTHSYPRMSASISGSISGLAKSIENSELKDMTVRDVASNSQLDSDARGSFFSDTVRLYTDIPDNPVFDSTGRFQGLTAGQQLAASKVINPLQWSGTFNSGGFFNAMHSALNVNKLKTPRDQKIGSRDLHYQHGGHLFNNIDSFRSLFERGAMGAVEETKQQAIEDQEAVNDAIFRTFIMHREAQNQVLKDAANMSDRAFGVMGEHNKVMPMSNEDFERLLGLNLREGNIPSAYLGMGYNAGEIIGGSKHNSITRDLRERFAAYSSQYHDLVSQSIEAELSGNVEAQKYGGGSESYTALKQLAGYWMTSLAGQGTIDKETDAEGFEAAVKIFEQSRGYHPDINKDNILSPPELNLVNPRSADVRDVISGFAGDAWINRIPEDIYKSIQSEQELLKQSEDKTRDNMVGKASIAVDSRRRARLEKLKESLFWAEFMRKSQFVDPTLASELSTVQGLSIPEQTFQRTEGLTGYKAPEEFSYKEMVDAGEINRLEAFLAGTAEVGAATYEGVGKAGGAVGKGMGWAWEKFATAVGEGLPAVAAFSADQLTGGKYGLNEKLLQSGIIANREDQGLLTKGIDKTGEAVGGAVGAGIGWGFDRAGDAVTGVGHLATAGLGAAGVDYYKDSAAIAAGSFSSLLTGGIVDSQEMMKKLGADATMAEMADKSGQAIAEIGSFFLPGATLGKGGATVGATSWNMLKGVPGKVKTGVTKFADDLAASNKLKQTKAAHSAEFAEYTGLSPQDILSGKSPLGELTKPKPAYKGPVRPDAAVDDLVQGIEKGTFDPLNRGKFTPEKPKPANVKDPITAEMQAYVDARGIGPARKTYLDPETGVTYKSDFGPTDPLASVYTDIIPGKGKTTIQTKPGRGHAPKTFNEIMSDPTLTTAQKQAMIKNLPPGQVPKGAKPNALSAADEARIQQGQAKLAELEAQNVKRPGGDPQVTIDWLQRAKEAMFEHPGSLNVGDIMQSIDNVAMEVLESADDMVRHAVDAVKEFKNKGNVFRTPEATKPTAAKPAVVSTDPTKIKQAAQDAAKVVEEINAAKPAGAKPSEVQSTQRRTQSVSKSELDAVDRATQEIVDANKAGQAQAVEQAIDDAVKTGDALPSTARDQIIERMRALDYEIKNTTGKFIGRGNRSALMAEKKALQKQLKELQEARYPKQKDPNKMLASIKKSQAGKKYGPLGEKPTQSTPKQSAPKPESRPLKEAQEAFDEINKKYEASAVDTAVEQQPAKWKQGPMQAEEVVKATEKAVKTARTKQTVSPVGKEVHTGPNKMLEDIKASSAEVTATKPKKPTRGPKEPRPTLKQVQEQYAGRPISPERQAAMNKRLDVDRQQALAAGDWQKGTLSPKDFNKEYLAKQGVPQKYIDEALENTNVVATHYEDLVKTTRKGGKRHKMMEDIVDAYKKEASQRGYAKGGFVSLFNTGGPAMGTDTVPAMLTPGEFVVRKAAVDAVGIETLKSINSMGAGHTNNRSRKSRGTNYLAGGGEGEVTGGNNMYRLDSSAFTDAVGSFDSSVKRLEELFKGGIQMSHKIEDMNVIVSVNHNGEPTDDGEMSRGMQRKIRREVSRGINSFIERQFPDMPRMDIEGTA